MPRSASPLFFFIFYLFPFFTLCHSQVTKPEKLNLFEPKEDTTDHIRQTENTISLILLDSNVLFCYPDTSLRNGRLYMMNEVKGLISERKKVYKDSLFILIKPAHSASYKATVDVLDEMVINKIKRFAMTDLTTEEKTFLYSISLLHPPNPIEIQSPSSVSSSVLDNGLKLYVKLKEDESVWYKIDSNYLDSGFHLIPSPVKKNLKVVISGYKEKSIKEKRKVDVVFIGDNSVKYDKFKYILEAFKENKIYKFQLVTSQN